MDEPSTQTRALALGLTLSETTPRGLSQRFLERVRKRLGLICLVLAGGCLLGILINLATATLFEWPELPNGFLRRTCNALLLLSCLGVFGLTRTRAVSNDAMLLIAPLFTLVGAALFSIPGFWGDIMLQDNMGRLPWAGFWLALMPLVVPLPLGRSALTAIVGASFPLLVHMAWHQATPGTEVGNGQVMLYSFLPTYIAAGLGLIPSQIIYRLGASMSAAEDRAAKLGSYQLVELLGKGGMGEVWRAEHELLARPAAVKLIKPGEGDEALNEDEKLTAIRRFEREARATSSLRSPHTIALYDFGVTPSQSLYYVMELLEGTDLESLVERFGPLEPGRVIHILRQACWSLAEAHGSGLIHRDIKPANIYACKLGARFDFVKILDFGIVGIDGSGTRSAELKLTADGYIVGTPAFLPPEMAQGQEMTARADLYSLGCVAYWLLTGHYVFDEENAVKMIINHAQTPPPPMATRTSQAIPADLEAVVMACLEKSPEARPQDALDLESRLAACADASKWTNEMARLWWLEHRPELSEGAAAGAAPVDEASAPTQTVAVPPPQ